jgi:hypothetical protein
MYAIMAGNWIDGIGERVKDYGKSGKTEGGRVDDCVSAPGMEADTTQWVGFLRVGAEYEPRARCTTAIAGGQAPGKV